MVSLLNKEKNINLHVFKEKPNVDIATPGCQSTDESVSPERSQGTLSQVMLSSQISIAHHLQFRL
jgi:hypothetical protein